MTDTNQTQQENALLEKEKLSVSNLKQRCPLILGIILLIGGLGFGWHWWQTSLYCIALTNC